MKALKLEVLFGARDRLSPALKAMIGGSTATNQALKKTQDQLKSLQAQQKQLEGYEKQKTAIAQNSTALLELEQRMAQLKNEMANNKFKQYSEQLKTAQKALETTDQKLKQLQNNQHKVDGFFTQKRAILETTKSYETLQNHIQKLQQEMRQNGSVKLTQEFKKATTQADQLKTTLLEQKQALQLTRTELSNAGIQTKNLAQTQINLRQQIDQANSASTRYKKSVAELEQQQQKEKRALDDLSKQLKSTEASASKLTNTLDTQKSKLKQLEEGLKETGLSSSGLASQQSRLKEQITETNQSLDSQKTKLANLNRVRESSNHIKKNAQMAAAYGTGMVATGTASAYALTKPVNESKNYEIEKNRIGALGVGKKTTDEIIAYSKAMKTFGTSTTENLALSRDALTTFGGDVHHAEMAAPMLAKMHFANEAMYGSEEGGQKDKQLMDMLKVIELRNGLKSEAAFKEQANMVQQVIIGSGGRVKANEYLDVIKRGGLAAKGMDSKAFYYTLEPLIQEMKGGSIGDAMMSAYQNLYQGRTTKRAVNNLDRLGLIADEGKVHHDKAGQLSYLDVGAIKGADLFKKDQFKWMEEVLIPQLAAKGITDPQKVHDAIGSIFTNRTASKLFSNMYDQRENIHKNMKLNSGAENIDQLNARAQNTATGKEMEAKAKLHNAYLELGNQILPIYSKALEFATDKLQVFTDWMGKNPMLAKALGVGLLVIATSLLAIGGLLVIFSPLIAGMMTLKLLMLSTNIGGKDLGLMAKRLLSPFTLIKNLVIGFGQALLWLGRTMLANPILLAITLIAVAAYAIYKNWEPIKAFFLELWSGISKWANSAWQSITQSASNAWSMITNKVGTVWNTIKGTFNQGVHSVIDIFQYLWTTFKNIIKSVDQVFTNNPILNFLLFPIGIPRMIIANWSSIKGFFADVWSSVAQSTSDACNSIYSFFSPIGTWFSNQWNTVKTGASDLWQSVKSGAIDAWTGIYNFFNPMGDWFSEKWAIVRDGASDAWETTKTGAGSVWDKITETFSPLEEWFSKRWEEIKNVFNGGITAIGAVILNWSPIGLFYKAFQKVMDWFGIELPNTFTGFGTMIIDGLASGIEKGFNRLKPLWEKINSWMPDWSRKTIDISSASPLMTGSKRFISNGFNIGNLGTSLAKEKPNTPLNLFNQASQIDLSNKVHSSVQAIKEVAIEPIIAKIRPINLSKPNTSPRVPQQITEGDINIQIHAQPNHSVHDIANLVRNEVAKLKRAQNAQQRTAYYDTE